MEEKKPTALHLCTPESVENLVNEIKMAEVLIVIAGREQVVQGKPVESCLPITAGCCKACMAHYIALALSEDQTLLEVTMDAIEMVLNNQVPKPNGELNLKTGEVRPIKSMPPMSKGGSA